MTRMKRTIPAALFTVGIALSASAVAQTAQPQTTPPTTTPPATPPPAQSAPATAQGTFTDEQVRQFATAWLQIRKVHEQYKPQLEAAPAEQKTALEQEANARMAGIVKAEGLDPETFNAISKAADQSEQLRVRIGQEVAKIEGAGAAQ